MRLISIVKGLIVCGWARLCVFAPPCDPGPIMSHLSIESILPRRKIVLYKVIDIRKKLQQALKVT